MFGFFRRQRRVPRATVGEQMDSVLSAASEAIETPPSWWVADYNAMQNAEKASGSARAKPLIASFPDTPLVFGDGQPSVFYADEHGVEYQGQERAKRRIDERIKALRDGERFKCLITGPAGTGKTALAWIIGARLQAQRIMRNKQPGRFFELLPSMIATKSQLDTFMEQLREGDTVFIDEIHILCQVIAPEVLFHTLADTGEARYPLEGSDGWLTLPPEVSWIAATTEPGKMDGTTGEALRRRFEPEVMLDPPTKDDLAKIVLSQDMAVSEAAAYAVAERAGGLPWQALLVYQEARAVARNKEEEGIYLRHVETAFDMMGVDENGLMEIDRKVIGVLLSVKHTLATGRVVHRMNESALCAAAGIDKDSYKTRTQPKLMRLGYLTSVGGQTLTDKAVADYSYLAE